MRTVWEGSRFDAEMTLLRWGRAAGARIRAGENSVIRRAHYLEAGDGYPSANGYLVAAPAGVEDKQRIAKKPDAGFEAKWTQVTGLTGTRWEPIRPLVASERDRSSGLVPVRSFGGGKGQRASHVELTA
ncbi:hypothetical protein [Streptomyces rhizosphaericus]|uniref:Uncharacterized protein n=1 Tax=Streptomyces rhizosphaericus TaxID=114699 RepID=A0A6G4AQE4_9ACTN|nr:hypothetical protein [Streptomyces rhizosphaericus]NEW75472.1 hypothetical protein [Streptomyces rhizosphaericus]